MANGLTWIVPHEWKEDLAAGRVSRDTHVEMIASTLRKEMNRPSVHSEPYRRLLDIMAARTVDVGHHRLMTTNWDYLLQRQVDAWIEKNPPGLAPDFLGKNSMVYHLNGSVEPGDFQNRSPFLLETDSAAVRKQTHEANQAFGYLLWSTLIVIVGMSFECDTDKGLLAALRAHEDKVPMGEALFIVVEPSKEVLEFTYTKLAICFPRAGGIRVQKGLEDWIAEGLPELHNRIFR